jgi:hypothetical protein
MCRGQEGANGSDDLLEFILMPLKEIVKDLLLSGDETAPIPPSMRVHDAAGAADLASRIRRTAHGIY